MPIHTRRKVIELGGSKSLTLPSDWADGTGVKFGDTMDVYGNGILLVIPPTIKLDPKQALRMLSHIHRLSENNTQSKSKGTFMIEKNEGRKFTTSRLCQKKVGSGAFGTRPEAPCLSTQSTSGQPNGSPYSK